MTISEVMDAVRERQSKAWKDAIEAAAKVAEESGQKNVADAIRQMPAPFYVK